MCYVRCVVKMRAFASVSGEGIRFKVLVRSVFDLFDFA